MDDSQEYWLKEDRIYTLCYMTVIYAMTMVIIGQFIYLQLHYIIGAIITLFAVISMVASVILYWRETLLVDNKHDKTLRKTLRIHMWINNVFVLIYVGLLGWTLVLMFLKDEVEAAIG